MSDVSNRRGGADLSAENVDIGGDVVGRDKVVQQTTHNNLMAYHMLNLLLKSMLGFVHRN